MKGMAHLVAANAPHIALNESLANTNFVFREIHSRNDPWKGQIAACNLSETVIVNFALGMQMRGFGFGVAAILLCALSACAPRAVETKNKDQYVVEYDPGISPPSAALAMAEAYCDGRGKRASLASQAGGGLGFIMLVFDCK
jgi:hypothetical protein